MLLLNRDGVCGLLGERRGQVKDAEFLHGSGIFPRYGVSASLFLQKLSTHRDGLLLLNHESLWSKLTKVSTDLLIPTPALSPCRIFAAHLCRFKRKKKRCHKAIKAEAAKIWG